MEDSFIEQFQVNLRKLVGLLADERRLRVVAAIALGASTVKAISTMTGLNEPTLARALMRLLSGGLVEAGTTTGFRIRIEVLRNAARGDRGPVAESDVLDSLARNGRLPRSRTDRLAVLRKLAGLFEPDSRYPEAEVNSRLRVMNPDYALLRRSLVDEGFLERANEATPDGRTVMMYWRADRG